MRLAVGNGLGPYQVLAPLGAGGMGEVYRARDTRLGRDVAIKVLPAERMADQGRRRRFVQEARAASALNHPNIVTVYEIESSDGIDFIVMEYAPGRTLDGLIPKHGMTPGEALHLAIPIADALAAAHAHGIVHRDVKPGNVVVSREGAVKVLDFGLAKLVRNDTERGGETLSDASAAAPPTRPGRITGTAGYMSPEQATGGRVDARSDIFSFGTMLYEMVTGRRAFSGKTVSETLTAVVRDEPRPPRELVPGIPEALERLILLCLRKEPERRFQHMSDVKVELQDVKEDSDSAALAPAAVPARQRPVAWGVVGVAAVLIVSAAAGLLWRSRAAPLPLARVVPLTALPGYESGATFSPDGEQVAFSWTGETGDNVDLYVMLIGSSVLHRLTTDPSTDCSSAWSPDGRQIAFVRHSSSAFGYIHVISPLGGPDRKLSDLPVAPCANLSWSPDGRWLAASRANSSAPPTPDAPGIFLVPVEGGEPRPLTRARPDGSDLAPTLSPDGRRLAYAACVTAVPPQPCDVHVVELGPDLVPTGAPRRLTRQGFTILRIAWSPDGRSLVYDTELGPGVFYLWQVGMDGHRPPVRLEAAGMGARLPAISGTRLVFTRRWADQDIVPLAPGRAGEAFAASSSFYDGSSQFSPDGGRIALESMRSGDRLEIWLAAADGQDAVQLTRGPGRWQGSPAWSPDGRRIAFDSQGEDGRWDIWTMDVEGGAPRHLTQHPGDENVPSWSRDGRWVYFSAVRNGKWGISRVPAVGGAEERIVQADTSRVYHVGQESLDGKTLFFTQGRNRSAESPLFAHPLAGGPAQKLLDCVSGPKGFAIARGDVYYTACGAGPDKELRRLHLATGKDAVVGVLKMYRGEVTVSPDGKIILYTSETRSGSDLMLWEGFR